MNIDTLCLEPCFCAGFTLADDTPGDACHLVDNRLPSLVLYQGRHVNLTVHYTKLKDYKGPSFKQSFSLKQSFSHPQAFESLVLSQGWHEKSYCSLYQADR